MYFPLTDGKLRQAMILFSKSVTWIYMRSLEHSWALKSETMFLCLCSGGGGGGGDELTGKHFQTDGGAD